MIYFSTVTTLYLSMVESTSADQHYPTASTAALNTVRSFANSALTLVGGITTSLIIARSLGPDRLGQFSYLSFITNLVVTILTLGLSGTITKFVSEFSGKFGQSVVSGLYRWLRRIAPIAAVAVATAISLTLLAVNPRWHFSSLTIASAALLGVFIYLATMWRSVAQGQQSFSTLLRVNIWSSWLGLTSALLVLWLHPTVTAYIWVMALPLVMAVFALFKSLRFLQRIPADNQEIRRQVKSMRAYLWPVAVISILDMIVWQYSEVLILGWFRSSAEVAYYAVAFNIASVAITTVASSFDAVFFPTISTLYGLDDHERIRSASSAGLRFLVFLLIPLCFLLTVMAPGIIRALYGAAYSPAIAITPVLIFSAGFGRISGIASSIMYSLHRQKIMLRIMFVIAIVNISLDFILIPKFGILGAALANGVAQIIITVLSLVVMRSLTKHIGSWGIYLRPLAASLPAVFLAWLISSLIPNLVGVLLGGLAGGFVFLFAARWTKAIRPSDRQLFDAIGQRLPNRIQRLYQLTLVSIFR